MRLRLRLFHVLRSTLAALGLALMASLVAFFIGVVAAQWHWPVATRALDLLRTVQGVGAPRFPVDALGRVLPDGRFSERPCPPQTPRTAVLVIAGQSNAANHAAERTQTSYPDDVLVQYEGRCYSAMSPLPGATGQGGEPWTAMADELVRAHQRDKVVLVSSGVGGTAIARWEPGADLHRDLLHTLEQVRQQYRPTAFLWVQGESDLIERTPAALYRTRFLGLVSSLRASGDLGPVFLSIVSRCGDRPPWRPDNPVAMAQAASINGRDVLLGIDMDELLNNADRQADGCHLSASGQRKLAAAMASRLGQALANPPP